MTHPTKEPDELDIELQDSLEKLGLMLDLHKNPKELLKTISKNVESFGLSKSTEQKNLLRGEHCYEIGRAKIYFTAMTYWVMAENARLANDELDAWQLLCKSNYLIGLVEGLSKTKLSKGSQTRSENSERNKIQIARLVAKKRPANGWRSERDAAKQIFDDAVKLKHELNMTYSVSNFLNLITEWMKDAPIVRDAFLGKFNPE